MKVNGVAYSCMLERNGVFYYRRVVPAALRAIVGKREILVSLRVKDKEQAKRKLHRAALEADAVLTSARHQLAQQTPESIAERWKANLLNEDAQARQAFTPKTKAGLDGEISDLDALLEEVRGHLTFGDVADLEHAIRTVVEGYGGKLGPDPAEWRKVAHMLLRAGLEAVPVLRRRALGDWSDPAPTVKPMVDPKVNPPLSLVLDSWLAERKPPSKTAHEIRATFARFRAACGGNDKPIREVGRADVRLFRERLLSPDAKTGKGKGALSPASVKKYMNLLGTVFSWAMKTGLIEVNPVQGMAFVATGKREQHTPKRQPFSVEQVAALFASPLYSGAESKRCRTRPGTYVEQDALWWLFPMTLFTGMRIEEAMGLRVEDVREVEGVLAFVVESRPDRTLKTASSARIVPVHDHLISLDILKWRDGQPRDGLLFPELRPDARHGKLTAALSKTAGRYLRAIGMPAKVTTHSGRHAFTDAMRRAKVEPEIRSALLGHSAGTMTARYGAGMICER